MIFNMTGGGNPLNFKVVGGTTEPSNPKENTIWVNTDKEITAWNFTSEQPENMKEGEVWFPTGSFSAVEFNVLKKNNVTVYPQRTKQMVSGTLRDVVAKTYQGGKWVDWKIVIVDSNSVPTGVEKSTNGTMTLGNGYISVTTAGADNATYISYSNKVNMANFKNVIVDFDSGSPTSGLQVNVLIGQYKCSESGAVSQTHCIEKAGSTIVHDVSALTGEYYVTICVYNGWYACSARITRWELE